MLKVSYVQYDDAQIYAPTASCLLEQQHEFIAVVRKWEMLAANEGKTSGIEKSEQEHVRHFLHKTCNQEVSGRFT